VASTRPFFVTLICQIIYKERIFSGVVLLWLKLYWCLLDGVLRMISYVRDWKCSQKFHAQLWSVMWRNLMAWLLDNWTTCDLCHRSCLKNSQVGQLSSDKDIGSLYVADPSYASYSWLHFRSIIQVIILNTPFNKYEIWLSSVNSML
jgi:hypothetical protein